MKQSFCWFCIRLTELFFLCGHCYRHHSFIIVIIINNNNVEKERPTRSGCTLFFSVPRRMSSSCTHIHIHVEREREKKKMLSSVRVCILLGSGPSIVLSHIHFFLWVLYCSTEHHRLPCIWYGFIRMREWEKDEIDSWSKDETTRVMVITVCSACTYELVLGYVSRIDQREKGYDKNRVSNMIDEQLLEPDKVC